MTKKVMLVEDTFSDIELTKRAFLKTGLDIDLIVAEDGKEALDYLSGAVSGSNELHELPAFILLDLKLPKIDGFQVLRNIRENPPTQWIPVIILTSSVERRDIITSYELGANSYLRKPVDFTQFSQTIDLLARYWLNLNKRPDR